MAAVVLEDKRPSRQEAASLVALVGGVAIAVWENTNQSSRAMGTLLCLAGTAPVRGAARCAKPATRFFG